MIDQDTVVPFGDPSWYNKEFRSPYYKDTHRRFAAKVRAFVEKELSPFVHEWDEQGSYPPELHQKISDAGLLAVSAPKEYGGTPPEDFDAFHEFIVIDELARCGTGGVIWALTTHSIALPPILHYGSQYLKDKIARDVLSGKKIMSLAISEPTAGSDVANLSTSAVKQGDHYIVNGIKKFITSGTKAHYITTAARTGTGMAGVSLLLIDANSPGVTVRRMKTQGAWISGTALITFEDVKVPIENLIGQENYGFLYVMNNFNHERYALTVMASRFARTCMEEAIKFGRNRKTFGKRLVDHQAIRHKIGEMARMCESTHALLEHITYQMKCGVEERKLASILCLAKVQATKTFEFCAREASQIFGGASCIRGGVGEKVERLYREVRILAIGGGSEEILLDLAMRQSKL